MKYVTFGAKKNPAVVFLHGWGGSKNSWINEAKRLSCFGFFCVAIDFSGFGEAEEPKVPYGVKDYAEEVQDLILGLGLKNVSLVGHSFGGRVAIWLSAQNVVGVRKLVLVDSAGVIPKRGIVYKFKIYKYKKLKKKVIETGRDREKLDGYGSSDYKILSPVMKETFKNVVNLDLLELSKTITCDTLLVWGRRDKDTPLYMAKKLNKAIKNSRLVVYDAGHFSYLECGNKFLDELYDFLVVS